MAIITISRELAALGDETACELVKKLNYRLVDRNALEEQMISLGLTSKQFQKYDEKRPHFWTVISQNRDDYLHYLRGAILAGAGEGRAIFIGRGAGLVLKDIPGVIRVFLAAPPQIRLERIKSYFRCDEKRARQIIEHSDSDREGFYKFFFETGWREPGDYHLILNTGYLHPELCAEIIKDVHDKILTEEAEAQCTRRIKELSLGQRIRHCVLYEQKIPVHFLETSVSGGKVVLYGIANAQTLIEAAVTFAKELAPGYTVQSEIQVVQEYTVMH